VFNSASISDSACELTILLIIRSQRSLPPIGRENQSLASKKQKHFDASQGPKNNRIDTAGASEPRALSSSTSQEAGHGSLEHLIDDRNTECPYHTYVLHESLSYMARDTPANTAERFMIHHPGEQYALFTRPDNKKLSISRECICSAVRGDNISSTETENQLAGEEVDLSGFQVGL
jgi:hypothetical protein